MVVETMYVNISVNSGFTTLPAKPQANPVRCCVQNGDYFQVSAIPYSTASSLTIRCVRSQVLFCMYKKNPKGIRKISKCTQAKPSIMSSVIYFIRISIIVDTYLYVASFKCGRHRHKVDLYQRPNKT